MALVHAYQVEFAGLVNELEHLGLLLLVPSPFLGWYQTFEVVAQTWVGFVVVSVAE